MCGISGFVSLQENKYLEGIKFVKQSIKLMSHRGPDSSGFSDEFKAAGIIFGHTRLSIQDLTMAGSQPMLSASKNTLLTFNGEIYNHKNLRKKLAEDGKKINWRSSSDTETLAELIDYFGIKKSLEYINGMFAFACYDKKQNKLFLARDKAGEKPLYYSTIQDSIIFASELSTLKQYKYFNQAISKQALDNFLKLSYIPSPLTIFEGTNKLEPGCFIEINLNDNTLSTKTNRWFFINPYQENELSNTFNYEQAKLNLDKILNSAVDKQLISDVEVGSFLSGGIDSSIVSAIAASQLKKSSKLKTFSVSFDEKELDESKHAVELSNFIGSDHYEINFSDCDLLELLRTIPKIYDEPFADSSQLPTIALTEFASSKVKVCLSGDGGDEVFGGYNRHIYGHRLDIFSNKYPKTTYKLIRVLSKLDKRKLSKVIATALGFSGINKSSMLEEKVNKFIDLLPRLSNDSFLEAYMSILSYDSQLFLQSSPLSLNTQPFINREEKLFGNFLLIADFYNYLPDDIFIKVDRASMNYSLEVRAPLIDEEIIEFASSLPISFKIDNVSKKILRDVGSKYVPRNFFNRPKQGFSFSIENILSNKLNGIFHDCRDYLIKNCSQLINEEIIASAMTFHGKKLLSPKFTWNLIIFYLWHEYYMSSKPK